jgi:aminopeptidase N
VPSLLRGFSAPVNIAIDLPDSDLSFLITHDSDLFNRWQAANRYATRAILALVTGETAPPATAGKFADAIAGALADPALDAAYKAELLKLPTQSDIAREKGRNVDPAAIDQAHRRFAAEAGAALGNHLIDAYETCASSGAYSPDAKSAGRRALRNAALTLLVNRGEAGDIARLEQHYRGAGNMTEAAHALYLIAGRDIGIREGVLHHFFERWQNDHLVIDQWFAAQAQSPLDSTLDRVKALTRHPLFKLTAPNKARALIGAFAMANPVQFNRPDGAGYDFVADMVLELDKLNPQVAARILGAFRSTRALEAGRAARALAAVKRIAGTAGLSRDVGEIAGRIVDA